MKRRIGFISNSSSTSFVLALESLPETIKELDLFLFGSEKYFPESDCSTYSMARYIFEFLHNEKRNPISIEKINELLNKYGTIAESKSFVSDSNQKISIKSLTEFSEKNKTMKFYYVYFDNWDLLGRITSYNNIFDKVPHIKIRD